MGDMERLLHQIRVMYLKNGKHPDSLTILDYAKSLKEQEPQSSYIEYTEFAKAYFKSIGWKILHLYYVPIPPQLEWFVKSFIDAKNPERILVPFATGLECNFFESGKDVDYHFMNKDFAEAAKLFININTVKEIPNEGSYDLIVSTLPICSIGGDNISTQIVEKCSSLLSEDGYCIFPFPYMITAKSSDKWLSSLENKGLYCTAFIDLPIGAFSPYSMVESVIAVFSQKKAEKRFVGLLSEERAAAKIINNYLCQKSIVNKTDLGMYVDGDIRSYSDYLSYSRIQSKLKALAKAYNAQLLRINQVGTVNAPNKENKFIECNDAVYIPKLGTSPAVTDETDFHIKAQNYFQVVVDTNVVLPRFLAFFLNTEEGLSLRQMSYRGTVIKAFNKTTLGEMVFPCPSLKLQSEYLKTYDYLEVLRVDVESLKNRLQKTPAAFKNIRKAIKDINNTGDKFAQWIESIPYPIATILKRYSVADDSSKRQEILFYFFEAYAIFLATILSAALNKDLVDCSELKEVETSYFEKASFGNWVRMDRALSNLFLKMIGGSEEARKIVLHSFKTSDNNLIKLLCSREVCNILDTTSNHRNSWKGHSGIGNETIYKERADILESMLYKLQENIKDLYERVRLIKPISLSYTNGVFINKVEVLTGSNPIFVKDTMESHSPLDDSKLYLQMIDTGEMLLLPPYFILKNAPSDAKNACYFYNRVEKGSTRYVSYHYDGRPEDIETGETAYNHIKELFS